MEQAGIPKAKQQVDERFATVNECLNKTGDTLRAYQEKQKQKERELELAKIELKKKEIDAAASLGSSVQNAPPPTFKKN